MNEEILFEPILQADEKIIKTFKPNKTRVILIGALANLVWALIVTAFFLIPLIMALTNNIVFEASDNPKAFIVMFSIFSALPLLVYIFVFITILVSYNKVLYAYTNKRILIRQGFIGVDYATLDFDMIGGLMVNVNFLDRLIPGKDNPGTIIFGSAASPVVSVNNSKASNPFTFRSIDHPYEVYRELKEKIDAYKANKK